MNLGWTEILLIMGVLLLLFGPSRLPGLGKSLGEAIRGFKKGIDTADEPEKPVNSQDSRIVHSNQDQLPPGAPKSTSASVNTPQKEEAEKHKG